MCKVPEITLRAIERFFDKVIINEESGCWEWQASKLGMGYGSFATGSLPRLMSAHRYSYILHYGEIPDGMVVMHSCDNPPCVNPEHLSLGTQGDNMRDRSIKGRNNSWWAKQTHCKKGHPFDEENTYLRPRNRGRDCLTCKAASRKNAPSV